MALNSNPLNRKANKILRKALPIGGIMLPKECMNKNLADYDQRL